MNTASVRCPAKVNLTLEILGKRPDGYHELRTIFQAVSLYDELTIRPAERYSLAVTGLPGVPTDESNLCLQALRLVRAECGIETPVAVELHKRIPVQAGLGGGSSDAAGMLAALRHMMTVGGASSPDQSCGTVEGRDRNVPPTDVLAARLGSDVAFFLHGGAMIGSGRGEVLEPVSPLAEGALVLAKPEVAVSTAAAYGLIGPADYTDGRHTEALAGRLQSGCSLPEVAARMYNVFGRPVQERWPAIAAVHARLRALQAQGVLLCGSGAAVLGLFSNIRQAEDAAQALAEEGLWAVVVAPVSHGVQVTEQ